MSEPRDPIIDACLDEILGGRTPPDLSQRILQALEQPPETDGTSEELVTLPAKVKRAARRNHRSVPLGKPLASIALILCLGAAILVGLIVVRTDRASVQQIGQSTINQRSKERVALEKPRRESKPAAAKRGEGDASDDKGIAPSFIASGQSSTPSNAKMDRVQPDPSSQVATSDFDPERVRPDVPPSREPDDQVMRQVNLRLVENWLLSSTTPAPLVDDREWCQRVFRLVIGRDPKPAEHSAYLKDNRQQRKTKLLQRLIYSDEYAEEFARRWGEYWTTVFLDGDTLAGSSNVVRDGLAQYFRRAILDRQPFDQVARGLITATGSSLPGSENYNGAVNFLGARKDDKFVKATSDVARLFLGRNIDCQQCHHDPHFDGGNQNEFWQLNAFFRQLSIQSDGSSQRIVLMDVDFAGDDGSQQDAKVFYTLPNGLLKVAYPIFRGQAIPTNGSIAVVNRRQELARLITASPDFSRNVANRIWEAMVGEGFVPSERFARKDELSYPETLVTLADQFAAHNFDLRKLIHWTALSEPFQREALSPPQYAANSGPRSPSFEGFYEQPSKPTGNVQEVLVASARLLKSPADSTTTAKVDAVKPPVGKDESARLSATDPIVTGVNASELIEDPMFKAVLGNTKLTDVQKAEHLFQMAFHRQPRPGERAVIDDMLSESSTKPQIALRNIWIALNSVRN